MPAMPRAGAASASAFQKPMACSWRARRSARSCAAQKAKRSMSGALESVASAWIRKGWFARSRSMRETSWVCAVSSARSSTARAESRSSSGRADRSGLSAPNAAGRASRPCWAMAIAGGAGQHEEQRKRGKKMAQNVVHRPHQSPARPTVKRTGNRLPPTGKNLPALPLRSRKGAEIPCVPSFRSGRKPELARPLLLIPCGHGCPALAVPVQTVRTARPGGLLGRHEKMSLEDSLFGIHGKALQLRSQRLELLASNIAERVHAWLQGARH